MKNLFLYAIFFIGTMSHAQSSAKVLLDKVESQLKSYESLYTTFDYELKNSEENIHDKKSGYLYLKGEKYHLSLLGIKQIFDGNKLYNISEEDQEVTISKNETESGIPTPSKVLSTYKSGYNIKMGAKKGAIQYIELTPQKKSSTKKVVIGVYPDSAILNSISEENTSGTKTILTLTHVIPNFPIIPLLLKYDKHKYKNYLITEID